MLYNNKLGVHPSRGGGAGRGAAGPTKIITDSLAINLRRLN